MRHIFIVNPAAGNADKSEEIRSEAEELSRSRGFEYLLFIVEYEGHEAYLTEKVCEAFIGEKIRIYSCGGLGTFQRILEASKKFKNVELAYYPCGYTNDILKNFKDGSPFYKLGNIVDGVPISFDLAEIDGLRFCNALSIGMTARIIGDADSYGLILKLNRNFPYWFSSLIDALTKRARDYEITVDGEDYSGRYLYIGVFNGGVRGGNISPARNARPNDGYLDFILMKQVSALEVIFGARSFCGGDVERFGDKLKIVRGRRMKRKADGRKRNALQH